MKRKITALILAVSMLLPFYAYADENTYKAPNVTDEMCSAQYWIKNSDNADKVIMTESEINSLNNETLNTPGTNMYDLAALDENFNGRSMADSLAEFESPAGLYLNGKAVDESYYQAIRDNIKNASVSENMQIKYGFAVNRSIMKAYPYEDFLSDSSSDPEWDEPTSTAVFLNDPLVIYFTTEDGKFSLVKSDCCSGWVPTKDIAICSDKSEWEQAAEHKNFLVVTGEKVYLEASVDKDLSEKMLTMGTVLELAESDPNEVISYRLPWNNYVVKMPARDENGNFYQKKALIPSNRDVSIGFLPYTTENVLNQAFKSLGNRYGWGGMLNSQDCSSFVREVYKCFGFSVPRNTTWQAVMPVEKNDMTGMSDDEKKEILDNLTIGSVLQFPGHEMIYIGKDNDHYYTINDVSSLVSPLNPESGVINPRSVVVNDLSTLRKDGSTWLENLSRSLTLIPENSSGGSTSNNSAPNTVTIYHTNDMHGSLIGSDSVIGIDKIAALKKQSDNTILLDGGDATQGIALATLSKGEDVIDLMNSAGYDAMAAGNHEFDNGIEQLNKLVNMAEFPILSANTYYNEKPYFETDDSNGKNIIIDKNGVKVGIFALTTANTATSTNPKGIVGVEFSDEIEAAKQQVKELEEDNADVIIALTHMGIIKEETGYTSYELAEAMADTGLDAIIDGHSHSVVNEKVGDIVIAQTGTGGTAVGKMDIAVDSDGDAEITETLLSATDLADVAPDSSVSEKVNEINQKQSNMLAEVIGETEGTLWGGSINQIAEARVGETNFGSLIADSIIYNTKDLIGNNYKDIPIVSAENGGGFRASVPNGKITKGSIINALPFANTVMYKKITPKILYEIMEGSVSSVISQDSETGFMNAKYSGSFLQIGGMRIEYDPNKEGNKVEAIYLDGKDTPLDRNDSSTDIIFASNDYVIGSEILKDIPVLGEGNGLMEAVMNYIAYITDNGGKAVNIPVSTGRIKTTGSYIPKDYTANIRIQNEDDTVASSGSIEFYVDGVKTTGSIDDNGILSFTVSDGPHSIKLYEEQAEVYVNNYSGAGVIESFGTWNGGYPILKIGANKPSTDTTTEQSSEESSEQTSEGTSEESSKQSSEQSSEQASSKDNNKSSNKAHTSSGKSSSKAASKQNDDKNSDKLPTENKSEQASILSDVKIVMGDKGITIGDKYFETDAAPYIQSSSSSVLVPLRLVAIALSGGDISNADSSSIISWNAETKTASIYANGSVIEFSAGSPFVVINKKQQIMENNVSAEIQNGRMFVPFRALGDALGVNVEWESSTKTAVYKVSKTSR